MLPLQSSPGHRQSYAPGERSIGRLIRSWSTSLTVPSGDQVDNFSPRLVNFERTVGPHVSPYQFQYLFHRSFLSRDRDPLRSHGSLSRATALVIRNREDRPGNGVPRRATPSCADTFSSRRSVFGAHVTGRSFHPGCFT